MDSPIGQKKLMAILLTDVVNFSDQAGRKEEATLRQLENDLALIRKSCQSHGGEPLKSTGDGILACFISAEQALMAAEEIQKELVRRGGALVHRIGIHVGDVYHQKSDVLGDGVNLTARLTEIAEPGGFCVSDSIHNSTRSQHHGFQIRLARAKVRNAPPDFRAYHFRPVSLVSFFRPTMGRIVWTLVSGALALSFLASPTLMGWVSMISGDFRPNPFLLAGICIAQYPAGFFLGYAYLRPLGHRIGQDSQKRTALGFAIYAGLAGFLLALLAASLPDPILSWSWPWFFLIQAATGVACWLSSRSWPKLSAPAGALLFSITTSCGAELHPSLEDFKNQWGSAIETGSDSMGRWQEFKKSREWAKVWTDRNNGVIQIQYRLPTYESCWTEERLGRKVLVQNDDQTQKQIGVWEKDYDPPFRSPTPRFSTEYWVQRIPGENKPPARAMLANELTSVWMLPPFVIFSPILIDLSRPITLLIHNSSYRRPQAMSPSFSVISARKSLGP